jgi:16S rRNA C967 or C1407 C5-methylase (RsmB/RsmF family)
MFEHLRLYKVEQKNDSCFRIVRKEEVVAYSMCSCLPEGAEENIENMPGQPVSFSGFGVHQEYKPRAMVLK